MVLRLRPERLVKGKHTHPFTLPFYLSPRFTAAVPLPNFVDKFSGIKNWNHLGPIKLAWLDTLFKFSFS